MKGITLLLGLWCWMVNLQAQGLQPNENLLLTGTYNRNVPEGIYSYGFNAQTGSLRLLSSTDATNPSFLAVSPNGKWVYAAEENGVGAVAAFSVDPATGALQLLNRRASMGAHPCHLSVHPSGRWLAVGNYSSGTVAILPIGANGSLDSAVQVVKHTGSGIVASRQASPHVHQTVFSPDGQFLLVPDLGIDKVMLYQFDAQTGQLTECSPPAAKLQPGSGPRHLSFHPNGKLVYVIEELTGMVSCFQYRAGTMSSFERIPALDPKYRGPIGSAHIQVSADGKFVYSSHRGEGNQLTVHRLQSDLGSLIPKQYVASGGKSPRHFTLAPQGNWILVANQASQNIAVLKRNKSTGLLKKSKQSTPLPASPVCLVWVQSH